jgi:hypothetical protein
MFVSPHGFDNMFTQLRRHPPQLALVSGSAWRRLDAVQVNLGKLRRPPGNHNAVQPFKLRDFLGGGAGMPHECAQHRALL